jgi:DNA-binding IclR family transcriptional regulator
VFATAAQVMQGKRMVAVLTVPSPSVRAPAEQRMQLLGQVRAAARAIEECLRHARR